MRENVFWLTCFFLLDCFGCKYQNPDLFKSAPSATFLREPVRLKLDFDEYLPLLQAQVNGRGPYFFALDTGTSGLVLSRKFLREINPRILGETVEMITPAGPKYLGPMYRVDVVKIGEAEFHRLNACSANMSNLELESNLKFAGVIGLGVFADCQITIDFPAGELIIERAETARFANNGDSKSLLPLKLSPTGIAFVPLTVNGTTTWAFIDSGDVGGFTFPHSITQGLDFDDKPVQLPGYISTFHGAVTNYGVRLKGSIYLGNNRFVSPIVQISGNEPSIGCDVLKHFVVSINLRKKMACFARFVHDPIGPSPSVRHHGFFFRTQEDCWLVTSAIAGTTLNKLGLRVDDRVISVNGRATSELSKQNLKEIVDRNDRLVLCIIRDDQELTIEIPITILIP